MPKTHTGADTQEASQCEWSDG